jgi:hypothetical protein
MLPGKCHRSGFMVMNCGGFLQLEIGVGTPDLICIGCQISYLVDFVSRSDFLPDFDFVYDFDLVSSSGFVSGHGVPVTTEKDSDFGWSSRFSTASKRLLYERALAPEGHCSSRLVEPQGSLRLRSGQALRLRFGFAARKRHSA